jgi:cell division ATPase FtsA
MFSLFQKPDEEIAVVFDIGSGSIGAALVRFSAHGIPTTLFSHREPLTFQHSVTSRRLLSSMTKLLKNVADHVQKEGLSHLHRSLLGTPRIQHVFCIFTSPWYVSQTKTMTISKEKPFLITKNSVQDILSKQEDELLKELGEGKYERQFGSNLKVLERKVIHTSLNGYEVGDPVGKRGREFEVTFFVSFISKDVSDAVEAVLRKAFHFKEFECYSSALSLTTAIRDVFPNDQSFLIADITGEVTDISFISKGVLLETSSFPLGRSSSFRRMSLFRTLKCKARIQPKPPSPARYAACLIRRVPNGGRLFRQRSLNTPNGIRCPKTSSWSLMRIWADFSSRCSRNPSISP